MPNHGIVTMLRGAWALWLAMDRGALVRLSGKTSRAFVAELTNSIPNVCAKAGTGTLLLAYRGGNVYRVNDDDKVSMAATNDGFPAGLDMCALATDIHGRIWWRRRPVGDLHERNFPRS